MSDDGASMPHYSYVKTFAPGKSKDQPEELEMPCHWGIITDVTITFPPGCHGYCHVHIDESLHQIFPTNPEADYALNAYTLEIRDEYLLLPGTRKIHLRGYNEGTYPHTISVTFKIKAPELYTLAELLTLLLHRMGVPI